MLEFRAIINTSGRIVIPAQCRRALQISAGDELVIQVTDSEARLFSLKHAIARAQERVAHYTKGKKDLAKQLIEMRREESKHE